MAQNITGLRIAAHTALMFVQSSQLKQKTVAERLGLTVRQVLRLVERYELEGPRGLISKLRDRPGVVEASKNCSLDESQVRL